MACNEARIFDRSNCDQCGLYATISLHPRRICINGYGIMNNKKARRQLSAYVLGVALVSPISAVADVINNGRSGWKLIRSSAPDGGLYASIMKTAELGLSDPDLAGLMVRCGSRAAIEILVAVVRPFPPRSRPQVKITAGRNTRTFEGTVTAGGAAIVLPQEAAALAGEAWQMAASLDIVLMENTSEIRGTVALDGLRAAYANLIQNCAQ